MDGRRNGWMDGRTEKWIEWMYHLAAPTSSIVTYDEIV